MQNETVLFIYTLFLLLYTFSRIVVWLSHCGYENITSAWQGHTKRWGKYYCLLLKFLLLGEQINMHFMIIGRSQNS